MLRRFSNSRSLKDNIQLGVITAFAAGMVNVSSLVLFFSFTSNVTGHYAILADEISNGNWFQVLIVFLWIFLFFSGSFISNFFIIHGKQSNSFFTHAFPLMLEITCFLVVGFYGQFFYRETLMETEVLVMILLFSMGLQNGLTASISNFSVKTTHLTGLTTDLAIHLSMLTHKDYRKNKAVTDKVKLLSSIATGYLSGGILAGFIIHYFKFEVFFYVSAAMMLVILYEFSKTVVKITIHRRSPGRRRKLKFQIEKKDQKSTTDSAA